MNHLVGQSHKTITDPSRQFHCGVCNHPLSVGEIAHEDIVLELAMGSGYEPECPNCGNSVCMYCGCTDTAPCVRKEYPANEGGVCSWKAPGICSACFPQLAELLFLQSQNDNDAIQPFSEPSRPSLVAFQQ